MSKADRLAVLGQLADRLSHERDVAAWMLDAAADDLVPKAHLDEAIADHVRGLKQLHRLARSL